MTRKKRKKDSDMGEEGFWKEKKQHGTKQIKSVGRAETE